MEKSRRPVDLPLLKIRLPIGGMVSIVHRIIGILLVLALPFITYWWDRSLASEEGFMQASRLLTSFPAKLGGLLLAAIFIQHLASGIRHLLLDLHIAADKSSARITAWMIPVITLGLIVSLAVAVFK